MVLPSSYLKFHWIMIFAASQFHYILPLPPCHFTRIFPLPSSYFTGSWSLLQVNFGRVARARYSEISLQKRPWSSEIGRWQGKDPSENGRVARPRYSEISLQQRPWSSEIGGWQGKDPSEMVGWQGKDIVKLACSKDHSPVK